MVHRQTPPPLLPYLASHRLDLQVHSQAPLSVKQKTTRHTHTHIRKTNKRMQTIAKEKHTNSQTKIKVKKHLQRNKMLIQKPTINILPNSAYLYFQFTAIFKQGMQCLKEKGSKIVFHLCIQ
jgi:hypothetical protein